MPDPDKFKADLQNHQNQKDAGHRLADVVQHLKADGWSHRTKGSHEIFTKTGMPMVNLQSEKDGKAKDYQIRQLRKTLFPKK